jgi:hypothetical protein
VSVQRYEVLTFTSGASADEIKAGIDQIPGDAVVEAVEIDADLEAWRRKGVTFTFRREVTDD